MRRLGSITILTTGLLYPAAAMAAETAWTDVTVRVYNTTELSSPDLRAALDTASSTLAGANVDVTWRLCPGGSKEQDHGGSKEQDHRGGSKEQDPPYVRGVCDAPIDRKELAIRILRSPGRSPDPRSAALGDALVDADRGEAVLGTLYFNRVVWLADAAGVKVSTLLGHAIAHELGHLLVATSAHSKHGLMRAVWSREEVRYSKGRDWAFTKGDIRAIQQRNRIGAGDSGLGTRGPRGW